MKKHTHSRSIYHLQQFCRFSLTALFFDDILQRLKMALLRHILMESKAAESGGRASGPFKNIIRELRAAEARRRVFQAASADSEVSERQVVEIRGCAPGAPRPEFDRGV
jgi:hypothetical protein